MKLFTIKRKEITTYILAATNILTSLLSQLFIDNITKEKLEKKLEAVQSNVFAALYNIRKE